MKKYIVCLAGFFVIFAGSLLGYPLNGKAESMDFEVTPVFPENQLAKGVNYFDLLLDKKESRTIAVRVRNLTDAEKTITVEVNPAFTNYNGVVEYLDLAIDEDRVPFSIKEAVTVQKEWKIGKGETEEIPLKIQMPNISYDGVVAGGIRISDITPDAESKKTAEDDEETDSSSNLVIRNNYKYVIALLLRENEKEVTPDVKLGNVSFQAINGSDAVGVEIENTSNTYIHDVRVEASIKKEGEKTGFTSEKSGMKMAPSSTMTYPVPVDSDLAAGEYLVTLTAYAIQDNEGKYKSEDDETYRYKWNFDQIFTLEETVVKGSSKNSSFIPKTSGWLYLLLFVILTACFAGAGIFYQKRKGRKTAAEKQQ